MTEVRPSSGIIRFGAYELDTNSGELLKNGIRIRLQEQPFQILQILLDRPGKVVTREELQKRLWPSDTFVNFEHGLYNAIKRLRDALGDSSETPRYVETLSKRGYRFVMAINDGRSGTPAEPGLFGRVEDDSRAEPQRRRAVLYWLRPHAPPKEKSEDSLARQKDHAKVSYRVFFVVATILATAMVAFFAWNKSFRSSHRGVLTGVATIVLADFDNRSGESVFDDTLLQALAAELRQSPFLNILSDQKVRDTLRLMGRAPGDRVDEETARDICQRTNGTAVLAGSIASLGAHYVIGLNAVNCVTGDSLAREIVEARNKEGVLNALDEAVMKLRGGLGESLATVQKFDTPIEQATTPSLEALKAYSLARKTYYQEGPAAAIPLFERAIELDPNFAMAYATMAEAYYGLGQQSIVIESSKKAFELRGRTSEREKFFITVHYYEVVTGQMDKSIETNEQWIQTYPQDVIPYGNLGYDYSVIGNSGKCVQYTRDSMALDPNRSIPYTNLMDCYVAINRLEDARAVYDQAATRQLDNWFVHLSLYKLAFVLGDIPKMESQLAWAVGRPDAETSFLFAQADTETFYGRLGKAREFGQRAVDSVNPESFKESAAMWQVHVSLIAAEFGNLALARTDAAKALALFPSANVRILAALAMARAGDRTLATSLSKDLAKESPLNTMLNFYWLPTIRAAIELGRGNHDRAIEALRPAASFELGAPPQFLTGTLYPVYLRGEAYLGARRGSEAATEFQKILDHHGIAVNYPIVSLSYLGLARAKLLSGDKVGAGAAYQDFFALWENADPGIPILNEARSESAKLR